ncbi:MAG: GDYXXLXY domain-containing protein [Akkermansia sp.]|nr:GDYXXLXY domain-containing protein [Akkermansia sp.]
MKRVYLLFAVVAVQLLWLVWNYVDRTLELEHAPVLRIECQQRDPRDLFRGEYVALNAGQSVSLAQAGKSICWDAGFCDSVNKDWDWVDDKRVERMATNPLHPRAPQMEDSLTLVRHGLPQRVAVFWRVGEDGLSRVVRFEKAGAPSDAAEAGEIRCLMWMEVISRLTQKESGESEAYVSIELEFGRRNRLRYYVEENTGDMYNIWVNQLNKKWSDFPADRLRYTVDLAIRESATAVPRMLYLNDVPYPEAVNQIREGTFVWLSDPVEGAGVRGRNRGIFRVK